MTNYREIKKPDKLDKLHTRIVLLRLEAERNAKIVAALGKRQRILIRHLETAEHELYRMTLRFRTRCGSGGSRAAVPGGGELMALVKRNPDGSSGCWRVPRPGPRGRRR